MFATPHKTLCLLLACASFAARADTAQGVAFLTQHRSPSGVFGESTGEEPTVATAEAVSTLRALSHGAEAESGLLQLTTRTGDPDAELYLRRAMALTGSAFALPPLARTTHAIGFAESDSLHLALSLQWLRDAGGAPAALRPLGDALSALALGEGCYGFAGERSVELTAVVARALEGMTGPSVPARAGALACLVATQQAGGSFGSVPSTATAALALRSSPAHAAALTSARQYLLATQRGDGSWDGSVRATALALRALGVSSPDWNVDGDAFGRAVLLLASPEPIQGASTTATLTVSNRSAFTAPGSTVRFWARPVAGGLPLVVGTQAVSALPPGGSAVVTASLPTAALSGRYNILAQVDPDDLVPELDELNNAATAPLNVRQENDVAVYAAGIRFTALGGSQVQVQVDVKNLGVALPSAVALRVYRGNPLSGGTLIGSATVAAGLPMNGSSTFPFTWTATGVNGPIAIHAVVDEAGALAEADESNNRAFRFYTPGAAQPTDLAAMSSVTSPSLPISGKPFFVMATVRNNATVEATRVPVALYEGTTLRAQVEVAAIPAQSNAVVALGPLTITTRTRYELVVDPEQVISDPNRANNRLAVDSNTPQAGPYELSVTNFATSVTSPTPGTPFTLTASLINTGTTTAETTVRIVDRADGTTWSIVSATLLPNALRSVDIGSFTAPSHDPRLEACVDPTNAFEEVNENDNCVDLTFGAAGSELRIAANDIRFEPFGADIGEPLTVYTTVRSARAVQSSAVVEWWHGRPTFPEGKLIGSSPVIVPPNGSVEVSFPWVRQAGPMEVYARLRQISPPDSNPGNNGSGRHLFLERIVELGVGNTYSFGTDVRVGRLTGRPAPELAVAYEYQTPLVTVRGGVALLEPTATGYRTMWRNELDGRVTDIVLADVDNDGTGEIVALEAGFATSRPHQVVARRLDGSVKWQSAPRNATCGESERLAAGDINEDGFPDFSYLVGATLRTVSGVDGSDLLVVPLGTVRACAVSELEVVDVEGDGHRELLVYDADDQLRLLNRDGTERWRTAPVGIGRFAITDLDLDGSPELVRPQQRDVVRAHDLRTGAVITTSTAFESLPLVTYSVGQLRQDGLPYVSLSQNGLTAAMGAFRPELTPLWYRQVPNADVGADTFAGTLVDLLGKGRPQVVVLSNWRGLLLFDGRQGDLLDSLPSSFPNPTNASLFDGNRPPVVADLGGNGVASVIVGKRGPGNEEWNVATPLYGPGQLAIFASPHWKKQPTHWPTRANVKGRIDGTFHVNSDYRWWTDHNTWNQQFDVRPAELMPDLELRNADLSAGPAPLVAGASATFNAVVRNVGGLPASNVRVAFYDGDPDAGGELLGESVLAGPLAPRGGSATATLVTTVHPEGSHDFYAVANPDGALAESGLENNRAYQRALVTAGSAQCDLRLDLASLGAAPTAPVAGDAVTLRATVQNAGAVACDVGALTVREGPLGNDAILGTASLPLLAPGASAQATVAVVALPGTHVFRFVVDEALTVDDADRSNNTGSLPLFVPDSSVPDLAVLEVALAPNPAVEGNRVDGTATFRNLGGLSGASDYRVRLGASVVATGVLPPLLPGEVISLPFNLTAPSTTRSVEVEVDAAGAVVELTEGNNRILRELTIESTGLTLAGSASPATAGPEQGITFSVIANRTAASALEVFLDADIADGTGRVLASLASGQRRVLPTGNTTLSYFWNTGTQTAGTYTLRVAARSGGRTVANAQVPVTVTGEVAARTAIVADRGTYTPGQEVLLTQRLTNASRNAELSGTQVRIEVLDAQGQVLYGSSREIPPLAPGAVRDTSDLFVISPDLPLGTYTARSEARDSAGALLASAQTQWQLEYTAEEIVTGRLEVETPFPIGAPVAIDAVLRNAGAAPLGTQTLTVELFETGALGLEASGSRSITLAAGAEGTFTFSLATTAVTEGQKLLVLRLGTRVLDRVLALAVAGPSDTDPPLISLSGVHDGLLVNHDVTPVFSATDQSAFTLLATLDGLVFESGTAVTAEGEHTLVLSAVDALGNASALTVHFAIDRTPPALTLTGVAEGDVRGSPVTLVFEATDAHPGTPTATLDGAPIASGAVVSTEGPHVWVVESVDGAGNRTTEQRSFRIDLTDPVVSVSGVVDGQHARVAVTPVVVANDTTLRTVDIQLDGAPFVSGAQVTAEGTHRLEVHATDAAGHTTSVLITFTLDFTAPVISVAGVTEGLLTRVAPTVFFAATDTNLADVRATLDGAAFASGATVNAEGPHTLQVTATDRAGNSATQVVHFELDVTPPVLTVGGVTNGTHYRTAVSPVFSATDRNPGTVTATLNGAPFASGTSVGVQGSHVLVVRAQDAAGNEATASVGFVIDTTPPAVNIAGVFEGASGESFTPTFTATDTYLVSASAQLDGAPFTSGTTVATAGVHTLVVTATDRAGNVTVRSVSFTVVADSAPPVFHSAVCAFQDLRLTGSSSIQPTTGASSAATNGAAFLEGSARVTGDLVAGGNVSLTTSSRITGTARYGGSISVTGSASVGVRVAVTPRPSPCECGVDPDALVADAALENDNLRLQTPALSPYFVNGGLLVQNSSSITLPSGRYYLTSLRVSGSARVNLAAGASVELYVHGPVRIEGSSTLGTSGAAGSLLVVSDARPAGGQSIELRDSSKIYARIAAPLTDVFLRTSSSVTGSVVGRNVTLSDSSKVTSSGFTQPSTPPLTCP